MKRLISASMIFLLSTSANAAEKMTSWFSCEDPTIGHHIGTIHSDRRQNFRDDNAGIYFVCRNGFTGDHITTPNS